MHLWAQCPLTLLRASKHPQSPVCGHRRGRGPCNGKAGRRKSLVAERAWEAKVFTPDSCPSLVYVEFELTTSRWR